VDALNPSSSTFKILVKLINEEGIAELYRGIIPTLQSLCASNFVYFYMFHGLKGRGKNSATRNLVFGAIAGAINVRTLLSFIKNLFQNGCCVYPILYVA
jgi:adenine nucleotide transporter 17